VTGAAADPLRVLVDFRADVRATDPALEALMKVVLRGGQRPRSGGSAAHYLRGGAAGKTLQRTALVHEATLQQMQSRLQDRKEPPNPFLPRETLEKISLFLFRFGPKL